MSRPLPAMFRPSPGSLLDRWLQRTAPQPGTFVCGVRRPDGDREAARPPDGAGDQGAGDQGAADQGAGGRPRPARWRYRSCWVDPLREDGAVRLAFGAGDSLSVRLDDDPWWSGGGPRPRPGLRVLSGRTAPAGDRVLLAVPPSQLDLFGLESW